MESPSVFWEGVGLTFTYYTVLMEPFKQTSKILHVEDIQIPDLLPTSSFLFFCFWSVALFTANLAEGEQYVFPLLPPLFVLVVNYISFRFPH